MTQVGTCALNRTGPTANAVYPAYHPRLGGFELRTVVELREDFTAWGARRILTPSGVLYDPDPALELRSGNVHCVDTNSNRSSQNSVEEPNAVIGTHVRGSE